MKNKKAIILFLIITLILSSLCYYVRIKGGEQAEGMTAILMFCPTISALIVHMVYYRKEKILGINRCRLPYVAAAVIIPFLYLGLSYGIYWLLSKGSLSGQLYSNSIGMLLLLIPSSLITAAGEEIGWRGFLLPKMAETWNLNIAIFFSGLIWAIWHYPLMITGLYQTGTPLWYQLPVFTIEIFAITAILAVLRLRSKSVWPAIILHASHNYFDQVIFAPLTKNNLSHYYVGETGIITAVLLCLIALLLLRKMKPVQ